MSLKKTAQLGTSVVIRYLGYLSQPWVRQSRYDLYLEPLSYWETHVT